MFSPDPLWRKDFGKAPARGSSLIGRPIRATLAPDLHGCNSVHTLWKMYPQAVDGRPVAAEDLDGPADTGDGVPDSFVHLHVHTEYSMLDGAARVDDLFAEAARMGMPALAMTDHGYLFGAVDFYQAGRRHGVKPIVGIEGYLAPGSRYEKLRRDTAEPYTHLTLLAESQTGYANLLKLVSLASTEGFFYKPRMDRELFERYHEGIIATTGCLGGEVSQAILKDDLDRARQVAAELRDLFGADSYFAELHDHGIKDQRRVNQELVPLARDLGIPLLASNDLHYTRRQDARPHEVLLCIQTGSTMADPKRFKLEGEEFYLKSPAEMRALFPATDFPDACDNTLLVAERCSVELEFGNNKLSSGAPGSATRTRCRRTPAGASTTSCR